MARPSKLRNYTDRVPAFPDREYVSLLSIQDRHGREKWALWHRGLYRQSVRPIDIKEYDTARRVLKNVTRYLSPSERQLQKQYDLDLFVKPNADRSIEVRVIFPPDPISGIASNDYTVVGKQIYTPFSNAINQAVLRRINNTVPDYDEEQAAMYEEEQRQNAMSVLQDIKESMYAK